MARARAAHPGRPVEVWAEDEHRLGLKPVRRRVWAPVGVRPVALGHHRHEWLHVTAFVRPTSGEALWYLSTGLSKPLFEALLAAFARQTGAGRRRSIVLVLDNAGWHGPEGLAIPEGISLVFLPPYSPELQPAEAGGAERYRGDDDSRRAPRPASGGHGRAALARGGPARHRKPDRRHAGPVRDAWPAAAAARASTRMEAEARASPRVLPQAALNFPKLERADVHLLYCAERIQGRSMPLDDLTLRMEVVDGTVTLRPLTFGVGRGRISAEASLTSRAEGAVKALAEVRFERLDVSRLMQASGGHQGAGALNGTARLEGTGRSAAEILGGADGAAFLWMAGGDLSRLLVDLAGLRLGSALLSSLGGGAARAGVECFVADLALRRGVLSTRALLLETEDALTEGEGAVDLGRERVEIRLRTESKRLTVGALPAPLLVSGTLKEPRAAPDPAAPAGRGGLAGALAALPTIQRGIGDDPRCEGLLARIRRGRATGGDAGRGGGTEGGRR